MPLKIPDVVIERLPTYYRQLIELRDAGVITVSSQEIGDALDVTPAQIRKDLSYFGRFGKQGRGYSVDTLANELEAILGFNRLWRVLLVGGGGVARTIASLNHGSFQPYGFDIVRVYEVDPQRIGTLVNGIRVRDLTTIDADMREDPIEIAIIAVSGGVAQEVTDALVNAGVCSILNYTTVAVQTPPEVEVRHVNPLLALQTLTYHLTQERDPMSAPERDPLAAP